MTGNIKINLVYGLAILEFEFLNKYFLTLSLYLHMCDYVYGFKLSD